MKKVFVLLTVCTVWGHAGWCQPVLPSLRLKPVSVMNVLALPSLQLPGASRPGAVARGNGTLGSNEICTSTCSIILPLTALELQGIRTSNYQVQLNWKTKNETASKGFDMERSLGDATHFTLAGSVPSSTSTSVEKKYALTDANSYAGISFYRVKQIDLDGNFAYSNTVEVKGYEGKETIWLSPNPASSIAVLSCYTANAAAATVKMLTAHGQVVWQKPWALRTGSNSLTIQAAVFPPGMYYVQLMWPDGHHMDTKLAIR